MSDSLGPQKLQHARLSCLSLSPRVCSDYNNLNKFKCLSGSYKTCPGPCLPLTHFPPWSVSTPPNLFGVLSGPISFIKSLLIVLKKACLLRLVTPHQDSLLFSTQYLNWHCTLSLYFKNCYLASQAINLSRGFVCLVYFPTTLHPAGCPAHTRCSLETGSS